VVDETVRIEGISDPGDEAIVLAVRDQCGRVRGTLVSAFGSGTAPADAEVLPRLATPPSGLAPHPPQPR
jgi:hypothetical protein